MAEVVLALIVARVQIGLDGVTGPPWPQLVKAVKGSRPSN
jgi:hypothetical protein